MAQSLIVCPSTSHAHLISSLRLTEKDSCARVKVLCMRIGNQPGDGDWEVTTAVAAGEGGGGGGGG